MARWQGFYDELASSRYGALLSYAMVLTGQRATAEDLVQEALVRVFSSPRRLASASHAESYVRRAIASIYIDDARRSALFDRTAVGVSDVTWRDGVPPAVSLEGAISMTVVPDHLVGGEADTPKLRYCSLG